MDKTTNLFIRACKSDSQNTLRRLRRLFNMFYLRQEDVNRIDQELLHIMSGIIDDHCPLTMRRYLIDLQQQKSYYMFSEEELPSEAYFTLQVLINRIRFTNVDEFVGYVKPIKWRRKYSC